MARLLTLTATLTLTDSLTGDAQESKAVSAAFAGSASMSVQTASIGTSPTSITLPGSPVNGLYLKNLHASQTITVTWTPAGGSSNVVKTLQPGGVLVFIDPIAGGITALSLTASGTATPVEYILVA